MNIVANPALPNALSVRNIAAATPEQAAAEIHGPDLIVDSIIPSNSFPQAGESVMFKVIVKNQGDQPAGPFNVRLSAEDGGLDQTARAKQGLAAGAKLAFNQMGPLYTHMGSFEWIRADVDSSNEVAETREDNNFQMITLSVQDPFPPGPGPFPPGPPGGGFPPGGPGGGFPHPGHPFTAG